MRALIQRVSSCSITIEGRIHSRIGPGFLVLVGIGESDTPEDLEWLVHKILPLRICSDEQGLMNLSLEDTGGELMVVSQFTLLASTKKGNRPSFLHAAKPDQAIPQYESLVSRLKEGSGKEIRTGVFGAEMQVALVNDGPVTIWLDSRNRE